MTFHSPDLSLKKFILQRMNVCKEFDILQKRSDFFRSFPTDHELYRFKLALPCYTWNTISDVSFWKHTVIPKHGKAISAWSRHSQRPLAVAGLLSRSTNRYSNPHKPTNTSMIYDRHENLSYVITKQYPNKIYRLIEEKTNKIYRLTERKHKQARLGINVLVWSLF